ncbi:Pleckstrin homology domain-containing family M member 3 [Toxocara canis]|uniref:Pleckstrin homology domain-containing family M member 3 n=1 Tax=Toxocara canis TaxID=6265 RepID=A0A0B2VVA0_TOXCA|nr:Pleckstrin homology domain-containing family M member 3 [Toxocara canis]
MASADLIKANLSKELKSAVKNGSDEADLNGGISDDGAQTICNIVEAVFIHGLKDPFFVRGSRYAKYPEPNFWPLLHRYTHVSIMNQISAAKHIKSDIGKARAWIRIVLNEDALEHYLNLFWHDPISMCKFYDKSAYLRDLEHFNLMIGCVKAISELDLYIPINSPFLNTWTPTPLILSGLVAGKPARLAQLRSRRREPPANESQDTEVAESALDLIEPLSGGDEPPSPSRPLSRGLNSGDEDELSSVYSHPSMLDGGILGGCRRVSREQCHVSDAPDGEYMPNMIPPERLLPDDSCYEVRVMRRRHRARRTSRSSSDDGSRSRSDSSSNLPSLAKQSPPVAQGSLSVLSPGVQMCKTDWLNSISEPDETVKADMVASPCMPESIEEEGDISKAVVAAREDSVSNGLVKTSSPSVENTYHTSESKRLEDDPGTTNEKQRSRGRAEPIEIMKRQVVWDMMSPSPSQFGEQTPSCVFATSGGNRKAESDPSLNAAAGYDKAGKRAIASTSEPLQKVAAEYADGTANESVASKEEFKSSNSVAAEQLRDSNGATSHDEIIRRAEPIAIPNSPEVCDVMSPTSEPSTMSLQDELLLAEGSAGNSLLGKGWTNHPPLHVQDNEPTSGQSSSTGTDSSHNFDAMIRNTVAVCDYEEMETKVRSRLDSEMFADTLNESMVSGIEIGRASRAVFVSEADMNGEDEYGISRAMIPLLTTIPRERGLDQQNFRCASCNRSIGPTFAAYMVCAFDAKYYCDGCWRKGDTSVIPSRLIHNWDFYPRPICRANMSFINAVADRPIIRIDKVNPHLYEHCETMRNIKFLREKMALAVMYLLTCRESVADDLRMRLWPKEYLFNDVHLYSFTDLLSVLSGQLERHLQSIINYAVEHIRRCLLCAQKGFVCEICACPRVIYPFQVETTFRCSKCYSVYHKECIGEKRCPKCLRREQYAKQPDISPDHLPLD